MQQRTRPPRRQPSMLTRLLVLVFLASLVPTVTLAGVSFFLRERARQDMERQIDATLDLAINLEQTLIDDRLAALRDRSAALAASPALATALATGGDVTAVLARAQGAWDGSDLLTVVDPAGVVRGRAGTRTTGDTVTYGGLVPHTLGARARLTALTRIPHAELAGESGQLAARATIPIQPTEGATDPRAGSQLGDALALIGAAPVFDTAGRLLGAVLAGDVLNNDHHIVDQVSSRAPPGLPLRATIALDGVRVSTNVPAPGGGRRAVGTLYSDAVMAHLRAGQEYRGRALVAGWQWQRSIYLPLTDYAGRVIGGSFVGIPEANFTALAGSISGWATLGVGVALCSLAGALVLAFYQVRERAMRPLQRLTTLLASGDLSTTIEPQGYAEMAALATALGSMIGRVRQTVAEIAGVSGGVKAASNTLATGARQTASGAQGALQVAGAALAAAEQVSAGARRAAGVIHELDVALTRIAAGAEQQSRAIEHVSHVAGELTGAVQGARDAVSAVLGSARAAQAAAGEGRHGALRMLAALQAVRLAAQAAADAGPDGAGLEPVTTELQQAQAVADELDASLRQIGQVIEAALDRLWDVGAVLNESGARAGAITQQLADVSAVVAETASHTQAMGAASRQIIGNVGAMSAATEEATGLVRQAQDHVRSIAEANQQLLGLADRIRTLAEELDAAAGQFRRH